MPLEGQASLGRSLYAAPAKVMAEEIRSLPQGRKVYERKSGLFFLSDRRTALQNAEAAAQAADQMARADRVECTVKGRATQPRAGTVDTHAAERP